jgi:hypothetical protein
MEAVSRFASYIASALIAMNVKVAAAGTDSFPIFEKHLSWCSGVTWDLSGRPFLNWSRRRLGNGRPNFIERKCGHATPIEFIRAAPPTRNFAAEIRQLCGWDRGVDDGFQP